MKTIMMTVVRILLCSFLLIGVSYAANGRYVGAVQLANGTDEALFFSIAFDSNAISAGNGFSMGRCIGLVKNGKINQTWKGRLPGAGSKNNSLIINFYTHPDGSSNRVCEGKPIGSLLFTVNEKNGRLKIASSQQGDGIVLNGVQAPSVKAAENNSNQPVKFSAKIDWKNNAGHRH